MAMNGMVCIHIGEMSGVVEARQRAMTVCEAQGLSAALSGTFSLIVTELATNIVNHAGEGDVLIRTGDEAEAFAIECLALDRGPGIRDLDMSLNGVNPAGAGQGNGLKTVRSLSSFFDFYSHAGKGSAILARIDKESPVPGPDSPAPPVSSRMAIGVVCLPLVPDEPCGDGWYVIRDPGRTTILVVDGLGHGPEAAKVQLEAIRIFRKDKNGDPAEIIRTLHAGLRSTRGGVAAVAVIDEDRGRVMYAGAGNISGRIITGPATQKMVSLNGTVGEAIRKIQDFSYSWKAGALMVMYSDGLSMQWALENYPGLRHKDPALIAGVLYRDHTRGTDDVTVLVVKPCGVKT
jgi:anti-sigma regulatory factor (Ser/Thr protein kinase)